MYSATPEETTTESKLNWFLQQISFKLFISDIQCTLSCLEGQIYNYDDCICDGDPVSGKQFFLKVSIINFCIELP